LEDLIVPIGYSGQWIHQVMKEIHTITIGAWRSLVARLLWEQEVGGSNPLAPTNNFNYLGDCSKCFFIDF
jgi:hypothetical protein